MITNQCESNIHKRKFKIGKAIDEKNYLENKWNGSWFNVLTFS